MTDFNQKYGVAFDEKMAEQIERLVSEGDSRSARIRKLVSLGLICENIMLDNEWYPPMQEEREDIVRSAMQEYVEEQTG